MTELERNDVVVAVGVEPCDAAIAYAAAEAERAGCGMRLVHVVHLVIQGPEVMLVEATDLEHAGRLTLNAALEHAGDVAAPGTRVTADLLLGGVVPTLVDATRDARMVVFQHRDVSHLRRLVTRSVTAGFAAHAHVPVVSVPSSWTRNGREDGGRRVTAGVDVPDRAGAVLAAATAAARSRGATLHVLHAWSIPRAYEDIAMTEVEAQHWNERATQEIQEALDALGEGPGGPVTIEVRRSSAAEALLEATGESEMLVIGRHDPLVPVGSHVGPVARAVLRDARCPVLLVDPRRGRRRRHHDEQSRSRHA